MENRRLKNKSGFGIAEILVAMVALGILITGFTQFMTSSQRGMKQLDVKGEGQNFQTTTRLALAHQDKCTAALGLDDALANSKVKMKVSDLVGTGTYSYSLSSLSLLGKTYAVGSLEGQLKVTSIQVNLAQKAASEIAVTGTGFIGKVRVEFLPNNSSLAQLPYVAETPILLNAKADGVNDSSNVWGINCYSESTIDPQKMCEQLGGRWLRNPDGTKTATTDTPTFWDKSGDPDWASHYMPVERCTMAGDLFLASNEAPVGIPIKGGTNDLGERVESCFYQASGKIQTYLCPGGSGTRAGYRCIFDESARQWQRRYFKAGQTKPTSTIYATCTKGVKISLANPETETLSFNEPLETAWNENWSGDVTKYWDHLNTVVQCNKDPSNDKPVSCINLADPEGALQGKAGACIYVSSSQPVGATLSILQKFEPSQSLAAKSYTGWGIVYPYTPSAPGVSASKGNLRVARVTPCNTVTVNTSAYVDPGLTAPDASAPAPGLENTPEQVQQCIYQADGTVSGQTEKTVYSCDNTNLNNVAQADWVGTGAGAPKLAKGNCWYFEDARISTYMPGGVGAQIQSSPLNSYVTSKNYTGWVYMEGALSDSQFVITAGKTITHNAGNTTYVNGIPCTGGVRMAP